MKRALCGSVQCKFCKVGNAAQEALEAEGYVVKFVAIGKKAAEGLGLKDGNIHNTYLLEGTLPDRVSEKDFKRSDGGLLGEFGLVELVYTFLSLQRVKIILTEQFLPFKAKDTFNSSANLQESDEPVGRHYFLSRVAKRNIRKNC